MRPRARSYPKNERRAFVDDDGVTFYSHLDGSKHRFTAELSMQIQHALGADIIFAFDELTALVDPYDYQVDALQRTHAQGVELSLADTQAVAEVA